MVKAEVEEGKFLSEYIQQEGGVDTMSLVKNFRGETCLSKTQVEALRKKAVVLIKALQNRHGYKEFEESAIELFTACGLREPFCDNCVPWPDLFNNYHYFHHAGSKGIDLDLEARDIEEKYGNFYIDSKRITLPTGGTILATRIGPGRCSVSRVEGNTFYYTAERALGIFDWRIHNLFHADNPGLKGPLQYHFYVVGDNYYRVPVTESIDGLLHKVMG